MNLDLIRFTDKYLGTLIRVLLYYYQKIRDLFSIRIIRCPYKRILVVKFWGIGNLIQASATFKAIKKIFPDAKVSFITLSRNRGLYEDSGLFDEMIYLNLHSVRAFLWDLLKKFFLLRSRKFDLVLDMEPLANFSEIVSFYIGVGVRVGFAVANRRSLFTVKVPFREDEHISRSFYRILSPFAVEMEDNLAPVPITTSPADEQYIEDILASDALTSSDTLIAINVNASEVADARRWSGENFAQLSRMLIQELDTKLIFIGSGNERERVQSILNLVSGEPLNLAGRTNLKQLAYALKRADIFITNDSGPMHLALAMGTPTVALFGPESPQRYGPLSPKHLAIYKKHDCSPCIKFSQAKKVKCTQDLKCIREISVDEVFEGVKTLSQRLRIDRT
jgi:heptosyltransferase-2